MPLYNYKGLSAKAPPRPPPPPGGRAGELKFYGKYKGTRGSPPQPLPVIGLYTVAYLAWLKKTNDVVKASCTELLGKY